MAFFPGKSRGVALGCAGIKHSCAERMKISTTAGDVTDVFSEKMRNFQLEVLRAVAQKKV